MPIKGIILIFVVAIVVAAINRNQIYIWMKNVFSDESDDETDENEEDLK